MNTAELTIQGKTFQAPCPYAAGHVLTEIEASVLNQTFLENLRNNFGSKIKKATEEGTAIPGEAEFAEYAASYKFGVRQVGTRVETDPVRSEAKKMARAKITEALKVKGIKVKDIDAEKLESMIEDALTRYPTFLAAAAEAVAARKAAVASLANLDLGA